MSSGKIIIGLACAAALILIAILIIGLVHIFTDGEVHF